MAAGRLAKDPPSGALVWDEFLKPLRYGRDADALLGHLADKCNSRCGKQIRDANKTIRFSCSNAIRKARLFAPFDRFSQCKYLTSEIQNRSQHHVYNRHPSTDNGAGICLDYHAVTSRCHGLRSLQARKAQTAFVRAG